MLVVSDPGEELLRFICGASGRFETTRATIREWRDEDAANELREQIWVAQGEERSYAALYQAEKEYFERTWRVWHEKPHRWRQEVEPAAYSSSGTEYRVVDGKEFWYYHPEHGPRHAIAAPASWGSEFEISHVFDPSVAHLELEHLELEVVGRTLVAGREAILARATRSAGWEDHRSEPLWWGADDYEFVVDAERGVLLRLASRLAGRAFDVTEVLDIAFDETFPKSTFALELPGVRFDETDWLT